MEQDYQFYRISGRITDSNAQPQESLSVLLRRSGETHYTEYVAADRTSLRGEYYFEVSLRIGSRMRIEVIDNVADSVIDYREFAVQNSDDITINFVI